MSNKDFDDFFKDLDTGSDNKSFFEDTTSKEHKNDTPKASDTLKRSGGEFFENDFFAPPPDEIEDVEEIPQKTEVKKSEVNTEKRDTSAKKVSKTVKSSSSKKRKKSKKSRVNTLYNWLITVVWVAAVLLVSVVISMFALSSINDLVGFAKESYEAEVTIPEGSSLNQIAKILKKNGIIDEPFTFEVYAKLKHKEDKLDSGTFTLNSNLGYDQIFLALKKKVVYEVETVTLTFFEGMTASEIGTKLSENGVCDYNEFMTAVDSATFEFEFEKLLGTNDYIYHKWEGYLFPDTYEFYLNDDAENVLYKFLNNFNNKFSESYYQRLNEMEMNLDEAITLASVIQSEANSTVDMYKVSSVFHNRLTPYSGFDNLQSDVTYFYYRDEIEPFVTDQALSDTYHTSYDTYFKKGLPVGPICCPGLDAIDAALNPDDTDYYYFVTDLEGNFYYAKSLAQHQENIAAAGRTGGRPEGDE